jgi:predicted ATPase
VLLANFEQVVDAGPSVTGLLERCPGLQLIVTSRQPLRVRSEREYLVAPLDVPEAGERPGLGQLDVLAASPAVQLFADRAAAVRPDFVLTEENAGAVAEICRRLDGVPLAIELAAARARLLPPGALLARLGRRLDLLTGGAADLPERQRTLRATIDWSYDLLDEAERELFAQLGVFAGGASLEAVESVCEVRSAGRTAAGDVLELLASLMEKSLLVSVDGSDEPRFRMLEIVREYALDRLVESGAEFPTRDRHLAWCVGFVERSFTRSRGVHLTSTIQHARAELPNIRAGVAHATATGRLAAVVDIAWYVVHLALFLGRLREVRNWMAPVLASPAVRDPSSEARLRTAAGFTDFELGDYDAAATHLDAALVAARAAEDRYAEGTALLVRAVHWTHGGEIDRARTDLSALLEIAAEAGDELMALYAMNVSAGIAFFEGEIELARETDERCLVAARRIGCLPLVAQALVGLAAVARVSGDLAGAADRLREAAAIGGALHPEGMAICLEGCAGVALGRGDAQRAAAALGAADVVRELSGNPVWPVLRPYLAEVIGDAHAQLGEAAFDRAWRSWRDLPPTEALELALGPT